MIILSNYFNSAVFSSEKRHHLFHKVIKANIAAKAVSIADPKQKQEGSKGSSTITVTFMLLVTFRVGDYDPKLGVGISIWGKLIELGVVDADFSAF